jgi:hypothetical protein
MVGLRGVGRAVLLIRPELLVEFVNQSLHQREIRADLMTTFEFDSRQSHEKLPASRCRQIQASPADFERC